MAKNIYTVKYYTVLFFLCFFSLGIDLGASTNNSELIYLSEFGIHVRGEVATVTDNLRVTDTRDNPTFYFGNELALAKSVNCWVLGFKLFSPINCSSSSYSVMYLVGVVARIIKFGEENYVFNTHYNWPEHLSGKSFSHIQDFALEFGKLLSDQLGRDITRKIRVISTYFAQNNLEIPEVLQILLYYHFKTTESAGHLLLFPNSALIPAPSLAPTLPIIAAIVNQETTGTQRQSGVNLTCDICMMSEINCATTCCQRGTACKACLDKIANRKCPYCRKLFTIFPILYPLRLGGI